VTSAIEGLIACVIYWQAKEISRVIQMDISEGEDINLTLAEHVSRIEWEEYHPLRTVRSERLSGIRTLVH
jgi:hypothetical protein